MLPSSPFSLQFLSFTSTDTPTQHVVNLLVSKRVALERKDKGRIDILPYLSSIPEENWPLVDESRYTIYRHLILTLPPYRLHSIFQNIAASALKEFSHVSLGKYSLVIYSDYQSRIDCGPCLVNKRLAEVRVTVRSFNQDICSRGAEATVVFLQSCFDKCGTFCEVSVKASCSVCRQYYVDMTDVLKAAAQGDTERMCERCHGNKITIGDLLNGFKETRPTSELDWRPFHTPPHTGLLQSIYVMRDPYFLKFEASVKFT